MMVYDLYVAAALSNLEGEHSARAFAKWAHDIATAAIEERCHRERACMAKGRTLDGGRREEMHGAMQELLGTVGVGGDRGVEPEGNPEGEEA